MSFKFSDFKAGNIRAKMNGKLASAKYAILFSAPIFIIMNTQNTLPVPYPKYAIAFE